MATLTITIGALSGTVSASNAKAQNVLNDVIALYGFTGTDQAKLDQVAQLCADFLVEKSQQFRRPDVIAAAEATVETDVDHQWQA